MTFHTDVVPAHRYARRRRWTHPRHRPGPEHRRPRAAVVRRPHASGRGRPATAFPDTVPSGEDPGRWQQRSSRDLAVSVVRRRPVRRTAPSSPRDEREIHMKHDDVRIRGHRYDRGILTAAGPPPAPPRATATATGHADATATDASTAPRADDVHEITSMRDDGWLVCTCGLLVDPTLDLVETLGHLDLRTAQPTSAVVLRSAPKALEPLGKAPCGSPARRAAGGRPDRRSPWPAAAATPLPAASRRRTSTPTPARSGGCCGPSASWGFRWGRPAAGGIRAAAARAGRAAPRRRPRPGRDARPPPTRVPGPVAGVSSRTSGRSEFPDQWPEELRPSGPQEAAVSREGWRPAQAREHLLERTLVGADPRVGHRRHGEHVQALRDPVDRRRQV